VTFDIHKLLDGIVWPKPDEPTEPAPRLPRTDGLKAAAVHEISHGIIGLLLGVRVVELRIKPASGHCAHVGKISDRLTDAAYSVAGCVAEDVFQCDRFHVDGTDDEDDDDEDDEERALAALGGDSDLLDSVETVVEQAIRDPRVVGALDSLAHCLMAERVLRARRISAAIDAAAAWPVGGILRVGLDKIRRADGR
jgi:hypothetical protein